MRLMDAAQPTFARHETFHPRYGWFRKACTLASKDAQVFTRDDAPVLVGVGKNMVRAIRFWGSAAKLIEVDPSSRTKRFSRYVPTEMGTALFGDSGWDGYMEDPGTLWLLHWLLLESPSQLPVWWLAFNAFHAVEFSDSDLEATVTHQLDSSSDWTLPHRSSIKKDISVLLRTYAPTSSSSRAAIDDVLDCPLRELNLIGNSNISGGYRFTLGRKPTLPPSILGFASLRYIASTNSHGSTITVNRLATEPGGPGRVFKLAESDLVDALERVTKQVNSLELVVTAGAMQLTWSGEPQDIAHEILNDYYSCPDLPAVSAGAQLALDGLGGGL